MGQLKLYYEWEWEAAEQSFRRAVDLDPTLAEGHRHLGWYLFLMNRIEDGLSELTRARDAERLTALSAAELGWAYSQLGKAKEAHAAAQRATELEKDYPVALFVLGAVLRDRGCRDEAIAMHERLAYVSAALGDADETIRGMEAVYAQRHGWTPWACRGVQAFAPMTTDPRFQEIARRLNLPG